MVWGGDAARPSPGSPVELGWAMGSRAVRSEAEGAAALEPPPRCHRVKKEGGAAGRTGEGGGGARRQGVQPNVRVAGVKLGLCEEAKCEKDGTEVGAPKRGRMASGGGKRWCVVWCAVVRGEGGEGWGGLHSRGVWGSEDGCATHRHRSPWQTCCDDA